MTTRVVRTKSEKEEPLVGKELLAETIWEDCDREVMGEESGLVTKSPGGDEMVVEHCRGGGNS